jgi:antitoxin HigA-1
MKKNRIPPVHPGAVLLEEFMKPYGLSAYAVAQAIGVPPIAISQIVRGKRGVSAEMALKLERLFGSSANMWLGIQTRFKLDTARDRIENELDHIKRFSLAAAA